MNRSAVTVDLGALRRNVRHLREVSAPAELWAVVKADASGHGAADAARVALEEGASALCVATAREGAALRRLAPDARILVMGPLEPDEIAVARSAGLEVAVSRPELPEGLRVHLKVDTGMGRFGMTPEEALACPRERVVGVMTHLATADEEHPGFARTQLERFAAVRESFPGVTAHAANSAAALRFSEARLDAVRCGVALYGLSPFGTDPAAHGLAPVLAWRSYVAQTKTLDAGESTGYGRRFVADEPTRIGLVPVGYADGFRRDMTGTEIRVAGELRRVVGTVSMDAIAVELDRELPVGTPVVLVGYGVTLESHARVAETITYELACGMRPSATRTRRVVMDS